MRETSKQLLWYNKVMFIADICSKGHGAQRKEISQTKYYIQPCAWVWNRHSLKSSCYVCRIESRRDLQGWVELSPTCSIFLTALKIELAASGCLPRTQCSMLVPQPVHSHTARPWNISERRVCFPLANKPFYSMKKCCRCVTIEQVSLWIQSMK